MAVAEATDTATPDDEGAPPAKGSFRLKPSQLILALGIGLGLVTALSGIAGTVFGWHDDSEVTREVFGNVPSALKAIFYTVLSALFVGSAYLFSQRAQNWERGQPDRREINARTAKKRVGAYRAGVYMQTLLRDGAAGLMHSLIYFPFLVLFAVTVVLEINHQVPESAKFLHGDVYRGYSLVGDVAGVLFLIGIGWAIVRRYVQRPYRLRIKTRADHHIELIVFAVLGITGFLAEGMRIALDGRPSFEKWSIVGWPLSSVFEGVNALDKIHLAVWVVHVLSFFAFLVVLPTTQLRHMFTSPINMFLSDRDRPKGAMKPLPNLTETDMESFGASLVEDFTWKQLLDLDACTVCGRCTSVCPAHATGKPLDPREIVLKVGQVMSESRPGGAVNPIVAHEPSLTVTANEIFQRVTPEEVWACTTCKACDEICPVNIEILDKILDMRRYLSMMESNFPTELGNAYRSLENQGNPWGMSQGDRADWAKALPSSVDVVDGSSPFEHEYLYWVGCAGSFDDKNKKVTIATAKLLQRAGVDFAILGPGENCTGDPARRSGSEWLFQMLAFQNIESMNGMGVKKIITQCPHCFNTLRNEYPQYGGEYEVVHHSQFLESLIETGRLDMTDAALDERVVYHDSCYLGRHNDVYLAPRRVLGSLSGIEIVEAPRNGTRGMCCGAGGARMWMEESTGKKVNTERSQELLGTGASRIATACPFCYIMIDDGTKENGRDDVVVADISMHLLEALERGAATASPAQPADAGGVASSSD